MGDTAIGLLFSAFILVNGIITMPAGYLADRWNRTRAMAVTIAAVVGHQRAGRPRADRGLRPPRGHPGLARVRPGGHRSVGQQRHRRLLRDRAAREGLLHPAVPELRRPRHGPGHRRRHRPALPRAGLAARLLRLALPRAAHRLLLLAAARAEPGDGGPGPRHRRATRWSWPRTTGRRSSRTGFGHFLGDMVDGLRKDVAHDSAHPDHALRAGRACRRSASSSPRWPPGCRTSTRTSCTSRSRRRTAPSARWPSSAASPGRSSADASPTAGCTGSSGARVVIPAVCIVISAALFMVSFIPMAFAPGVRGAAGRASSPPPPCVPALRAGLSDAAPAHVRGAGFGAFNLASVVFGSAAAPLVTSAIAAQFGGNYRTAFLIILPIAFLGAGCLLLARTHIERDAAKVFEAVVVAMAAQQAEEEAAVLRSRRGSREGRPRWGRRSPTGRRPSASRRRTPGRPRPRRRCSPCGRRRR